MQQEPLPKYPVGVGGKLQLQLQLNSKTMNLIYTHSAAIVQTYKLPGRSALTRNSLAPTFTQHLRAEDCYFAA